MSASARTLVSSVWRTNAIPMPTSRPAKAPRPMLRDGIGEVGVPGTVAGVTVFASISVPESRSRVVNSSAAPASAGPMALAMPAASSGSAFRAVTCRIAVSPVVLALASIGVPGGRPRPSRSGSITSGEPRTAT